MYAFGHKDQDCDYMEPSRLRPRLDYSDPAVPFRTPRYQDSYGAGSSLYSHDYYGSDRLRAAIDVRGLRSTPEGFDRRQRAAIDVGGLRLRDRASINFRGLRLRERVSTEREKAVAVVQGRTRSLVERFERRERLNSDEVQAHDTTAHIITETAKTTPMLNRDPQITGRELTSSNDGDLTEDLKQNHDVFLSTLRSRLTKLQVLRHFWDRNDINGAIDAVRKLPDHSVDDFKSVACSVGNQFRVQADLMSILMEKMEILTLDLFSCLLAVLLGLLDSKIERHANISLEMLLKLVAVFGPVVRSTISAPPVIGPDLHAEKRLECNQCFIHVRKIQKILPVFIRRGGLLAKCAQELNLVLQNS
ncbi:hypothetical protein HYC85_018538 [Camellia sinensis]|uniref:Katanin p80 subunit C-terminal domain-containing protein n=1 Tax=Camellia sinensis TaxID=4442 RepID=A0A7J7GWX2_CAMSI|nr:hypothetical protein HYC85_018538 [Camellia sinensis]